MTTEDRTPRAPEPGRARRDADPLQMTEFEKRIAEWEARHDVAARGRRAAPDVVQHYCAHERLNEVCHARPAGASGATARRGPQPPAQKPAGRLRYLFSRLF